MIHTDAKFNRLTYSEYYSKMELIADDKVIAHLMITLGQERLPKGHKGVDGWGGAGVAQNNKDGIYAAVSEIYFSNISAAPVEFTIHSLRTVGQEESFGDKVIKIQPDAFYKSRPFVNVASNYHTKYPYILNYSYKSEKHRKVSSVTRQLLKDVGNDTGRKIAEIKRSLREK